VIQIKAVSPDLLADIQAQTVDLLRQRHRLQPYQDNDFDVRNLAEMFAACLQSTALSRMPSALHKHAGRYLLSTGIA